MPFHLLVRAHPLSILVPSFLNSPRLRVYISRSPAILLMFSERSAPVFLVLVYYFLTCIRSDVSFGIRPIFVLPLPISRSSLGIESSVYAVVCFPCLLCQACDIVKRGQAGSAMDVIGRRLLAWHGSFSLQCASHCRMWTSIGRCSSYFFLSFSLPPSLLPCPVGFVLLRSLLFLRCFYILFVCFYSVQSQCLYVCHSSFICPLCWNNSKKPAISQLQTPYAPTFCHLPLKYSSSTRMPPFPSKSSSFVSS